MTYEEIIAGVREDYEGADARSIYEHVAIEFDITGEVEGCFYIEIADRNLCVEPYDYYDKDARVTISTNTIEDILRHRHSALYAFENGLVRVEGNLEKVKLLRKLYLDIKK